MKRKEGLKPLLKYPGGKGSELNCIFEYSPQTINNYIEPFVGGGALYFAIEAKTYYINDISDDLMSLYTYVKEQNEDFFNELKTIVDNWNQLGEIATDSYDFMHQVFVAYKNGATESKELITIVGDAIDRLNIDRPLFQLENMRNNVFKIFLKRNLVSIIKRIVKNEVLKERELDRVEIEDNFECAIKSSYYMYFRELYNNPEKYDLSKPRKVAMYLFIREYCYSSMFRFNSDGKFNVPYGGISYNKKTLTEKIEYYHSEKLRLHLKNTDFKTQDFETFVNNISIKKDDFMFLDPPYDTVFSEYDKNSFGREDQMRLAKYLINKCPCRFMLIIKKTEFIENLYTNAGLRIQEVDKTYFVSFKNRNKKNVKHLIITNY